MSEGGATQDFARGPLRSHDPVELGRHRLISRLGDGGMGTVYLAEGPLGLVAIKAIHPHLASSSEFRARFQREVQASFRLRGPFTAELVDFDVSAEVPWLATEFVDAPNLEQLVEIGGPMSPAGQLGLGLGLLDALTNLHAAGIIHRDLKPSNILCAQNGPRVIDFGIAAAAGSAKLTVENRLVGTVMWMSPERLEGQTGAAADIYAWGTIMAYAASGKTPYTGDSYEEIFAQLLKYVPQIDYDACAPDLQDLVKASVSRKPEHRPSAGELRDQLVVRTGGTPKSPQDVIQISSEKWAALDQTGQLTQVAQALQPPPDIGIPGRPQRRRRRAALASIAILVLAAGGLGIFLTTGRSDGSHAGSALKGSTASPSATIAPLVVNAQELKPVTVELPKQDSSGARLSYSTISPLPEGLTLAPDGNIEGTPDANAVSVTTNRSNIQTKTIPSVLRNSDGRDVEVDFAIRDTAISMPNYVANFGCNNDGSCKESVPNVAALTVPIFACAYDPKGDGSLIYRQSIQPGTTVKWGQSIEFWYGKNDPSCDHVREGWN